MRMSGHLLLFCLISVTTLPLADSTVQQDIIKYIGQIQIIRGMLAAENCEDPHTHDVDTRETLGTGDHLYDIELEVQRKQYQRLRAVLIECRVDASKPTTAATVTTTPRSPTTKKTTTTTTFRPATPTPLPAMCLSATNLTESWRRDHNGGSIRPKNKYYNCDTKEMIAAGRPWFRFSGAAGNRLMNKCVPFLSCGTQAALWSDDPMPTQVGVITQVNAYGEVNGNCRHPKWTKKISVVRCSTSSNDYVYRYDGHDGCAYGFCGMSV